MQSSSRLEFARCARPTRKSEALLLAAHSRHWAARYRAWILSVLCIFLSACQPDGPIAEVHLGWSFEYEDLARLEKILLLSGFQYEIQDRQSTESAVESVYPWRYKAGGVIYSYFNYSPDGADRLRAILSLKESTGRLSVRIGGGDNCPSEGFTTGARKRIEELLPQIKIEFGQNVQVKYIDSERCAA